MWLWLIAGFGALTALAAWASVRRLRRRLEDLSQSYWELRYEYTRLRSQVAGLGPGQAPVEPEPEPAPVAFVPLASLKRDPPTS